MKTNYALTRMTFVQEQMHETDKKENPERHRLTKDSYEKQEMLDMCFRCAEHYEWKKQLQYDAGTNRYYKVELNKMVKK